VTDEGPPRAFVDGVLTALADPMRRELLDLLAAKGEATATALAADVAVSRQAVLKHLTVLANAGLVTQYRAGREVRFRVVSDHLAATARWMAALAADWDRRLRSLKSRAENI
jgi:DNA-binding transcriptional ArsR family regulator